LTNLFGSQPGHIHHHLQEDFHWATGKLKISLCRSFIILFFFFGYFEGTPTHNGVAGQQQLTLLPNANAVIMSSKPIGLVVSDLGWFGPGWFGLAKSKSKSDICIIKIDVHAARADRTCVLAVPSKGRPTCPLFIYNPSN